MLYVNGYLVDIDVARELQKFEWSKARWASDKFHACSPFRYERRPSFAVRLDNGVWIDSGGLDENWRKGNFIKLLSFLRNETDEETEDYLLAEYGVITGDADSLQLKLNLTSPIQQRKMMLLNSDILEGYKYRHPYLAERGIEEKWQRAFKIGYCTKSRAVTFPWFDRSGNLVNIKFRAVVDKRFWYFTGGQPIKAHLYALNLIQRRKEKEVFIVESEIDAITLWQAGLPAIALGGASLTLKQKELIIQSPIETLIIATDNDAAGRRIGEIITTELGGYLKIRIALLPEQVKDINELTHNQLIAVTTTLQDSPVFNSGGVHIKR